MRRIRNSFGVILACPSSVHAQTSWCDYYKRANANLTSECIAALFGANNLQNKLPGYATVMAHVFCGYASAHEYGAERLYWVDDVCEMEQSFVSMNRNRR